MSRLVVVLEPNVGLGPKDLAELWESDEEASNLGPASVEGAREEFLPGLVEMVIVPLAINVASAVLYDLIRRLIRSRAAQASHERSELELIEHQTAGGDRIVVVRLVTERS